MLLPAARRRRGSRCRSCSRGRCVRRRQSSSRLDNRPSSRRGGRVGRSGRRENSSSSSGGGVCARTSASTSERPRVDAVFLEVALDVKYGQARDPHLEHYCFRSGVGGTAQGADRGEEAAVQFGSPAEAGLLVGVVICRRSRRCPSDFLVSAIVVSTGTSSEREKVKIFVVKGLCRTAGREGSRSGGIGRRGEVCHRRWPEGRVAICRQMAQLSTSKTEITVRSPAASSGGELLRSRPELEADQKVVIFADVRRQGRLKRSRQREHIVSTSATFVLQRKKN